MNERGEPREQPSDRDPGRLCAEHIYLLLAATSLSASVAAYVLDAELPIDLNRGAYAIMVAFFVAGYCGWLSRSAQRRLRTGQAEVREQLARMAAAIEELREQVASQRVVYVQPTPRRGEGVRYLSTAVGGEGDTVPLAPKTGLDAESIRNARALARRMIDGPTDELPADGK